jgi:hypothetical protein
VASQDDLRPMVLVCHGGTGSSNLRTKIMLCKGRRYMIL